MDFVIDQMVQLHHIYVAHGHRAIERLPSSAVDEDHLPGRRKTRSLKHRDDIFLSSAVEDRACDWNAVRKVPRKFEQVFWRKLLDLASILPLIHLAEEDTKFAI